MTNLDDSVTFAHHTLKNICSKETVASVCSRHYYSSIPLPQGLYLWSGSFYNLQEKDFVSISSVMVLHCNPLAETESWDGLRSFPPLALPFSLAAVG